MEVDVMQGEVVAYRVTRVREADGASCPTCGQVFGVAWREGMVPWTWRQSQAMHERGTGHKMQLFKLEPRS
jgi:hypothetical protein